MGKKKNKNKPKDGAAKDPKDQDQAAKGEEVKKEDSSVFTSIG